MMGLDGKVALISGGGRGIGAGIAQALARDGADIAAIYTRFADVAEETAKQIRALGRRCEVYQADVADEEQDRAVVEAVAAKLGRIDILVNCAGIASRGRSVLDTEPTELRRVVGVHAFGSFYLTQAALPHLRKAAADRGRADVIYISSITTETYGANGAPYNMGKAAMEALSFTLAKEERANGIHVNVVAPGVVETEMGRRLVRATQGVENIKDIYPTSPFGRVCQPEDVANLVAFLCSDGASYVNNQVIYVHGGNF